MTPRRIDTDLDRLYQLPPDEFTAARNALAKDAGAEGADVRRLAKPPIAAWAVNQIYWKRRDIYDALIDASSELRKLHKAILSGRRADIREPAKAHDEAIDAALKAALGILGEEGHPGTDATRQAILTTLRALPADDPPGRLTRTLQPGGFEMLAGLSIAGPKSGASSRSFRLKAEATTAEAKKADAATPSKLATQAKARTDPKAAAQAKAAQEAAARAVREAEQAAGRAEFEAARLTREATKAAKELEEARETLETAQQALEDAKAAAATTARARETADRRAKEAERALDAARRAFKGGARS
jgi:pyruvate/2-oxoglutarate dehydrogenase complex dihydrolipoamide acyltransferase (E2) component